MATKSTRSSGSQHNARGVVQGNTLVGPQSGLPFDEIVDAGGKRRLAVDANITLSGASIAVDLDVVDDGVHIGDPDTGFTLQVEPDGSINANTEVDAADGDNIAISAHPNQIFTEFADTITTAAFELIFSYTATTTNTKIIALDVSVGTPARVRLKLNGTIIREKRSSSLERNVLFIFSEHRSLTTGDILTVEAKVERLIKTSYDTFTSMEGYRS